LRFVLREQRDFYRPLAVIQDTLKGLDDGSVRRAITPREAEFEAAAFVSARALAALAGVQVAFVLELASEGMLIPTIPDGYDRRLASYVSAVDAYLAAGGALRDARLLRHAAQREVDHAKASSRLAPTRDDAAATEAREAARTVAAAALFAEMLEVQRQQ
jgi:hypothetical protein